MIGNIFEKSKGNALKFYTKNGCAFETGDIFTVFQQANVLEKFAKYGFYEGEVVEDLIFLKKLGGSYF